MSNTQVYYAPERAAFLVKLNGTPVGGLEGYTLHMESKCYPCHTVNGGTAGKILRGAAVYTLTLKRLLPDLMQMPNLLGTIWAGSFQLAILHKNWSDTFADCRLQSSTESMDGRGRVFEELVCVSTKRTHSDAVSSEV